MKNAYFFITTPLQYLNALEARYYFSKTIDQAHLIILADYAPTLKQLNEMIEARHWHNVTYLWADLLISKNIHLYRILSFLPRRNRLRSILLSSIKDQDHIFIGHIVNVWSRYICKIKLDNKKYNLDDGLGSLRIYSIYKDENKKGYFKYTTLSKRLESLLLGLSNTKFPTLTMFTSYNLDSIKEVEVINHNYKNLKKLHLSHSTFQNKMFFIGQPLATQGKIRPETYVKIIDLIFDHYKKQNLECYYLPHRSGNKSYIPKYWNVLYFEFPLEYAMLIADKHPKVFATLYSSAGPNLAEIFSDIEISVHYWKIDNTHFFKAMPEFVYKYLNHNASKNQRMFKISSALQINELQQ